MKTRCFEHPVPALAPVLASVVLYLKLFYFFLQSGDCSLRLISLAPVAEQLYQWYLESTPGCQKMVLDVGRGACAWLAVAQVLGWAPG